MPVPTVLLAGGVLAGVLLALLCRGLITLSARSRARRADQRLRAAVTQVADELVVVPVETELSAYAATWEGLRTARR